MRRGPPSLRIFIPISHIYMPIRTPSETLELATEVGLNKARLSGTVNTRFVLLSIIAGAYIALGGTISVYVSRGMPGLTADNPSLQSLLAALTFPVGLTLIVALGGELFTGNNALLMPGMLRRNFGVLATVRNWTLVWLGNFVGALAVLFVLVYAVGLFEADPWRQAVVNTAQAKVSMSFWTVFAKGIGANWCVCLAVWLALSARRFAEKALACWIPVAVFVALGYEHCIANMFFIPCGMLYGADVTVTQLFIANLVPATLGNIVGGALPVGILHHVVHRR